MQKTAIFLMGPTAAGKTALAIQLAQRMPLDIISVDSAMVYRGMDIGTGKPTKEELALIPQQLIDICDPAQPYSVAKFCEDARQAMQSSWDNQRIPLLVGGTMLYFKALQFGLSTLPTADQDLRNQLLNKGDMHAQLAALDPQAAQRLNPNDMQRVQRALEINILTGKTLQQNFNNNTGSNLDCTIHSFALLPDRAQLHATIERRFNQMLRDGLIDEVQQLLQRGDLHPNLPAIRSVGYRQVWAHLTQQVPYDIMRAQAIAATRQLAKRQYTWLRSWPQPLIADISTQKILDTIANTMLHFCTV